MEEAKMEEAKNFRLFYFLCAAFVFAIVALGVLVIAAMEIISQLLGLNKIVMMITVHNFVQMGEIIFLCALYQWAFKKIKWAWNEIK